MVSAVFGSSEVSRCFFQSRFARAVLSFLSRSAEPFRPLAMSAALAAILEGIFYSQSRCPPRRVFDFGFAQGRLANFDFLVRWNPKINLGANRRVKIGALKFVRRKN